MVIKTVQVNFGGAVGEIPTFVPVDVDSRYPSSCYDRAGRMFIDTWDWLCANSPIDRPFRVRAVMKDCPHITNKDQLAAFIQICCSFQRGDRLKKIGGGTYLWDFEDDRLHKDPAVATLREHSEGP